MDEKYPSWAQYWFGGSWKECKAESCSRQWVSGSGLWDFIAQPYFLSSFLFPGCLHCVTNHIILHFCLQTFRWGTVSLPKREPEETCSEVAFVVTPIRVTNAVTFLLPCELHPLACRWAPGLSPLGWYEWCHYKRRRAALSLRSYFQFSRVCAQEWNFRGPQQFSIFNFVGTASPHSTQPCRFTLSSVMHEVPIPRICPSTDWFLTAVVLISVRWYLLEVAYFPDN